MFSWSLIGKRIGRGTGSTSATRSSGPERFRVKLRIEALEGRCVPSGFGSDPGPQFITGQSTNGFVGTVAEPDGGDIDDPDDYPFTANVTFNDGSNVYTRDVHVNGSALDVYATHTFANIGTFPASVVINEEGEGDSGSPQQVQIPVKGEVSIDVKTFIPDRRFPFIGINGFGGPVYGIGDGHDLGQPGSNRTEQKVTVNLNDNSGQPDEQRFPPSVHPSTVVGPFGIRVFTVQNTGNFQTDVSGGGSEVDVHMSGSAFTRGLRVPSPFGGGALIQPPPIHYDLTIKLDASSGQATYDIQGTRGNFPATEVDINGQQAFGYSPGTGFSVIGIPSIVPGLRSTVLVSAQGTVEGTA